ncbi:hypothetical protein F2Q70_00002722 [Brassica cretica]|uniref:Uncharacterized protein n=1 Tax=Brassica cretica TaxID=69181 RepID=A0A8S9IM26_BRACR|nr:hypothetical protein F2Q70_00002722 [Brassica cretica]
MHVLRMIDIVACIDTILVYNVYFDVHLGRLKCVQPVLGNEILIFNLNKYLSCTYDPGLLVSVLSVQERQVQSQRNEIIALVHQPEILSFMNLRNGAVHGYSRDDPMSSQQLDDWFRLFSTIQAVEESYKESTYTIPFLSFTAWPDFEIDKQIFGNHFTFLMFAHVLDDSPKSLDPVFDDLRLEKPFDYFFRRFDVVSLVVLKVQGIRDQFQMEASRGGRHNTCILGTWNWKYLRKTCSKLQGSKMDLRTNPFEEGEYDTPWIEHRPVWFMDTAPGGVLVYQLDQTKIFMSDHASPTARVIPSDLSVHADHNFPLDRPDQTIRTDPSDHPDRTARSIHRIDPRMSVLELSLKPRPRDGFDRPTSLLSQPIQHSKTDSQARFNLGREESEDVHIFSLMALLVRPACPEGCPDLQVKRLFLVGPGASAALSANGLFSISSTSAEIFPNRDLLVAHRRLTGEVFLLRSQVQDMMARRDLLVKQVKDSARWELMKEWLGRRVDHWNPEEEYRRHLFLAGGLNHQSGSFSQAATPRSVVGSRSSEGPSF